MFSLDSKLIVITVGNTVQLRLVEENLDNLLARGCDWLQDYLTTSDELREELCPRG
ncbi:hypothetical protein CAL7716_066500 [Calothrix sp. PCC 7716]|nr:hypothetical protein CAL7716_066500 [Calothrix sp. PCC 7716]